MAAPAGPGTLSRASARREPPGSARPPPRRALSRPPRADAALFSATHAIQEKIKRRGREGPRRSRTRAREGRAGSGNRITRPVRPRPSGRSAGPTPSTMLSCRPLIFQFSNVMGRIGNADLDSDQNASDRNAAERPKRKDAAGGRAHGVRSSAKPRMGRTADLGSIRQEGGPAASGIRRSGREARWSGKQALQERESPQCRDVAAWGKTRLRENCNSSRLTAVANCNPHL